MKWVSTNPSLGAGKSSRAMGCPPARLLRRVARERPPPRPSLSCSGSAGPSPGLGHRTRRHRPVVSKAVAQRFARPMQNARWLSLPTGVGSSPAWGTTGKNGAHGAPANRADVPTHSTGRRTPPCVTKDGQPLGAEGRLPYLRTLGGHRRYPDREIRALLETLSEPLASDQPPATSP